jgi:V/A-type H+-transporting ATPase subunit I
MLRDPKEGETPPTLIRPPKLFRPVAALFFGLGIAPGYTESDVSVPFMCYFALFFAMLVGDGAYGLIFLAATLWGWRKTMPKENGQHRPRVVRSWLTLLTVFSFATVVRGLPSNTWFGAGFPFASAWPTVKWLADPSYANMMLLCFTIGVSHLMLARIWSGVQILNDRTCLAQFGWAGVLLFMYIVTNSIVGIFSGVPQWAFWMFGVSLVLVFGFTLKGDELKSRGIELGMLPLNIMSALGDIISYVRLFAVGLASVKVAENFNNMATGLVADADSIALKAVMCVAMVAILLVGHGLNLAMAGLSILVHAVRLNTLEFSNHKGVSWAGYAFSPFRKN